MSDHRQSEEQTLRELMSGLDPTDDQVARMERAIEGRLQPQEPTMSLFDEWIELLRIKPLSTPALAFAGCAGIVLFTPLSGLILSLLG